MSKLFRTQLGYRPASTFLGRVRQFIAHRVFRRDHESCDRCGRAMRGSWWCDRPALWRAVYGRAVGTERGRSGLLCERCFERFATDERHFVHWQAHVIDRERPEWPRMEWPR